MLDITESVAYNNFRRQRTGDAGKESMAVLLSWLERSVHTRKVIGSSPITATIFPWPVGQAVKTPPFHGGNAGSSPARVTNGSLAQLGEHLPYKQRVSGSSPLTSTTQILYSHQAVQDFFVIRLKVHKSFNYFARHVIY